MLQWTIASVVRKCGLFRYLSTTTFCIMFGLIACTLLPSHSHSFLKHNTVSYLSLLRCSLCLGSKRDNICTWYIYIYIYCTKNRNTVCWLVAVSYWCPGQEVIPAKLQNPLRMHSTIVCSPLINGRGRSPHPSDFSSLLNSCAVLFLFLFCWLYFNITLLSLGGRYPKEISCLY